MPQGWLQVNRFVTPQNLKCTVSGAENRAKSNFRKTLPTTLTRSRFCEESFFLTQWNQDFMGHRGEGGTAVPSGRWSVARRKVALAIKLLVGVAVRLSPFALRQTGAEAELVAGGWRLGATNELQVPPAAAGSECHPGLGCVRSG